MRKLVASLVCLLYLGVSLVLPAVHHHEKSDFRADSHCAGCIWLKASLSDVPLPEFQLALVDVVILPFHSSVVPVFDFSIQCLSDRGPPASLA